MCACVRVCVCVCVGVHECVCVCVHACASVCSILEFHYSSLILQAKLRKVE